MPLLILAVLLVIASIALLWYRVVATKQRSAAAATASAATGLVLAPSGDDVLALPFPMFHLGYGRSVRNRMSDPNDPGATVFDHHYTVGTGTGTHRSSTTTRQTCAVHQLPFAAPLTAVSRRGLPARLTHHLGLPDVVVGHVAFDEMYSVKSADVSFTRTLLDRQLVDFFLREGQGGSVHVELAGNHLLVTTGGEIPPEQFHHLLAFGRRLLPLLPALLTAPPVAPPAASSPSWGPPPAERPPSTPNG